MLLFTTLGVGLHAQNAKQGQRKDTTMAPQHNPPRHRHGPNAVPKADTAKGKLNKEKNAGNVQQPDK